MRREDDFNKRRESLKNLTESELETRFWQLCDKITEPMIKLAEKNTSPSIERSVLLRMGFSSPEAAEIVSKTIDHSLMGKGCGHLVYRLSKDKGISIREAGLMLMKDDGFSYLKEVFKGGNKR